MGPHATISHAQLSSPGGPRIPTSPSRISAPCKTRDCQLASARPRVRQPARASARPRVPRSKPAGHGWCERSRASFPMNWPGPRSLLSAEFPRWSPRFLLLANTVKTTWHAHPKMMRCNESKGRHDSDFSCAHSLTLRPFLLLLQVPLRDLSDA